MKEIVKILPFYELRIWGGGERLKNELNYHTDVRPLGEVYNVVALQGHAGCEVSGMDMTLSALYKQYPEWLNCDTEELPVYVNILDSMADLSVRLHPDGTFARAYNGDRGKPEAWVILDTTEEGRIQFGHKAKTVAEFKEKTEQQNWEGLLEYLKAVKDAFIDIPAGTLHVIGTGVLTCNISRNADCTLRLYDYDRTDPSTGKKRDIQPEQVYENVNMPDTSTESTMYPSSLERGIHVTKYWDESGLYTLMHLQVKKMGIFSHPRFTFYTYVDGEGTVQDVPIKKGETLLVPEGMGMLKSKGNMDVFLTSYRSEEDQFMKLQLALDDITLEDALSLVHTIRDYIDIIEIGTPFIIEHGIEAVRVMEKEFLEKKILADLKIMDAGDYEVEEVLKAGVDYITVLGVTDILTVKGCIDAADRYGKQVVVDMICVEDMPKKIAQMEGVQAHIIAVHVSADQQATGREPLEGLRLIKEYVKAAGVSVAGGINGKTVSDYTALRPDIVIVGSRIVHVLDPVAKVKKIYEAVHGGEQ